MQPPPRLPRPLVLLIQPLSRRHRIVKHYLRQAIAHLLRDSCALAKGRDNFDSRVSPTRNRGREACCIVAAGDA